MVYKHLKEHLKKNYYMVYKHLSMDKRNLMDKYVLY